MLLLISLLHAAATFSTPPQRNSNRRRRRSPPSSSSHPAAPHDTALALPSLSWGGADNYQSVVATYATTAACIEDWLVRECDDATALGFDTETKPSFKKGVVHPPATVQLSTPTATLVVPLLHLDTVPPVLLDTLASTYILKVGVGVDDDAIDLWLHHSFEVNARLDLTRLGAGGQTASLRGLAAEFLGVQLNKSNKLTLTDWSRKGLSVAELEYAALDAWAGRAIHDELVVRRRGGRSQQQSPQASSAAEDGADAGEWRPRSLGVEENLGDLVSSSEQSCAELYAYRRVRQAVKRTLLSLDEEIAGGLPYARAPNSAQSKRRAADVRRAVSRARRDAAAVLAPVKPPTAAGGASGASGAAKAAAAAPKAAAAASAATAKGSSAKPQSATKPRSRTEAQRAAARAADSYKTQSRELKLERARALHAAQQEERAREAERRLAERARRRREGKEAMEEHE